MINPDTVSHCKFLCSTTISVFMAVYLIEMCTKYFRKIILLFRMLPAPNISKQLQEELSFILIHR